MRFLLTTAAEFSRCSIFWLSFFNAINLLVFCLSVGFNVQYSVELCVCLNVLYNESGLDWIISNKFWVVSPQWRCFSPYGSIEAQGCRSGGAMTLLCCKSTGGAAHMTSIIFIIIVIMIIIEAVEHWTVEVEWHHHCWGTFSLKKQLADANISTCVAIRT